MHLPNVKVHDLHNEILLLLLLNHSFHIYHYNIVIIVQSVLHCLHRQSDRYQMVFADKFLEYIPHVLFDLVDIILVSFLFSKIFLLVKKLKLQSVFLPLICARKQTYYLDLLVLIEIVISNKALVCRLMYILHNYPCEIKVVQNKILFL